MGQHDHDPSICATGCDSDNYQKRSRAVTACLRGIRWMNPPRRSELEAGGKESDLLAEHQASLFARATA